MKIEKLNSNKIKITLFEEDLSKWDINIDNLKADSDELKGILWSIIRNVQTETDFNTDGAQLMVEALKKTDSFVMIVTKSPASPKTYSFKKPADTYAKVNVFTFTDLDHITHACREAADRITAKSTLYKYEGTYYLVLRCCSEYVSALSRAIMSEYSHIAEDSTAISAMLAEHGTVMFKENAIKSLCEI